MANLELFHSLTVSTSQQTYPVFITGNALQDGQFLRQFILAQQVLIVTNQTVALWYLPALKSAFSNLQCDVVILPDGEIYKNSESLFTVYDALITNNHHRDTTIVALGGGVIGDIAGFAASTYQRGVRLIQIPTTVLAQVDASIGGKTAINHTLAKNMIGSFYQPHAVLIDLNTLNTLPEREFRAGFGEIIKYGLLKGGEFYVRLSKQLALHELTPSSKALADCIAECCQIKMTYVEMDEKETGQRALLNLGHTFAHALEAITQYRCFLHGEAVAIGLYCAAFLSYQLGDIPHSSVLIVEKLLKDAGLPHKIPKDISLVNLLNYMLKDKKIKNKTLTFVLIKAEGMCYLNNAVTESFLLENLVLCQK